METEERREELLQKHKKEKKELQSKIQVLKKSATKGDRKKKKEVQEEIAKLELELSQRQEAELLEFENEYQLAEKEEAEIAKSVENIDISEGKKITKITKAQKRRDKKVAEQKEREKYILEQEIENENGSRYIEMKKINELLKKEGLMIYEIEADGNCLYNAIDHQLKEKTNVSYGVNQLRSATSAVMKSNINDYLPFLSNPNTGEMMTEEEFYEYCNSVANTTNWGGQIELRALSHAIKRAIKVIQADGPILVMGEEYADNEALIVCYHRHMYRLGEHYNSIQAYAEKEETY